MTSRFPGFFRAVLVLSVCLGLTLTTGPAQAAEYSFPDAADDATGLTVESTPRSSDPELDILSVQFSSDATSLSAVVKLAALGTPAAATGATRTAGFTYEGAEYWFRFQAPQAPMDTVVASGFFFRKGADTIPCGRCSGKLDAKTNSVRFTAEFKSMTAGMKSMDSGVTPIGPGSKITALTSETYRTIANTAHMADAAVPPGELEFAL